MRFRVVCVVVLVALAAAALSPSGASAATRVVEPGQSIQAAIDAAQAGDRIVLRRGTYRESLLVSKDRLRLEGSGATLLPPPSGPAPTPCSQLSEGAVTGICVAGEVRLAREAPPQVVRRVAGVRITGITVRGFSGHGVLALGAARFQLDRSRLLRNGGYGVFALASRGVTYVFNRAERNGEPGFYVGDSPRADVVIARNRALSNEGEGILLRNAQGGRVERNRLEGNCSGLIVLAGAPGPAGRFRIARNRVISNNRFCAGEPSEGEPPVSGIGIALAGAFRTEVVRNVVLRNRPARRCKGRCVFPGGIVAVSFGRFRPTRDLVAFNTALSNVAVDLRWDRSGAVGFTRNRCRTSQPRGLCPQPRRMPRGRG